MNPLTQDLRDRIVALLRVGTNAAQVARDCGVNYSVVYKINLRLRYAPRMVTRKERPAAYKPTEEEIEAACLEIQATWSDHEREIRYWCVRTDEGEQWNHRPYTLPVTELVA